MAEFLCESRVSQADLEELSGCLDGVLHEHQIRCEGRQRVKRRVGKNEGKREVIRVRQEDGTGKGKEGNKVCKVTE